MSSVHLSRVVMTGLADQTGGKDSGADGAAALLEMKPTTPYSRILALGLRTKESDNTKSRVA